MSDEAADRHSPDQAADGRRACILVVEDDPQLQMLMRWQLQSAGFEFIGVPPTGTKPSGASR
jgi:hypothetical protein